MLDEAKLAAAAAGLSEEQVRAIVREELERAAKRDAAARTTAIIASKGTLDWAYPPLILASTAGPKRRHVVDTLHDRTPGGDYGGACAWFAGQVAARRPAAASRAAHQSAVRRREGGACEACGSSTPTRHRAAPA